MEKYIQVRLEDARRVFDFLGKAHDLMHQPSRYMESKQIERFVEDNYSEIRDLYYKIVWNWLPEDARHDIENE